MIATLVGITRKKKPPKTIEMNWKKRAYELGKQNIDKITEIVCLKLEVKELKEKLNQLKQQKMETILGQLILKAHANLTWKKGKNEYAPTFQEIETEIKQGLCSEQWHELSRNMGDGECTRCGKDLNQLKRQR